jgi:hypothetical protein
MKNLSSFSKLSRNEQRQIKGGQTVYFCSRCFRKEGVTNSFGMSLIICDMALRICDTPDCNGLCNGTPGCFLDCTAGEDPFGF